jgi:hypothetical protein
MPTSAPSITVRPATVNDIPVVLDNLLDNSLEDLLRYQINPVLSLADDLSTSEAFYFSTSDGEPVAIVGIDSGCLWMHMCKAMEKYPVACIKYLKRWFRKLKKARMLWNQTGIEYGQAIKMAQFFGFKILRVYPSTLTHTYLVEMVLLCR